MALKLTVLSNVGKTLDDIAQIEQSELPFALSFSIGKSVRAARDDIKAEMKTEFDRPTKSVLNNVKARWPSKRQIINGLEPEGETFVTQIVEDIIKIHMDGGAVSELLGGTVYAPVHIALDQYGNIPRLASKFKTWAARAETANGILWVDLGKEWEHGGIHAGIYEITEYDGLFMLVAFYPRRVYRQRLDLHKIAQKRYAQWEEMFWQIFKKNMKRRINRGAGRLKRLV